MVSGRIAVLGVLLVTASACALSTEGANVIVAWGSATRGSPSSNRSAVRNCKQLGMVSSSPPYLLPGDDERQMRTQTAALGGDTLLISTSAILGNSNGIAFDCARNQATRK